MAEGSPVALVRSAWWDMRAGGNPARSHRILLAWPEAPPPPGGYPVLLLLDGNGGFATAVEAYRARSWRAPGLAPALILGIGHAGDAPFDQTARTRDYTPVFPGAPVGSGGADAFLDFIETALLPELERRFPIGRSHLALFGHSFGGLLAVHALLTRPGLFRRLIAASPSLWWGGEIAMDATRRFAAAPPEAAARAALLVTVGALEEENDGTPHGAIRAARRMRGNAAALVALLKASLCRAEFVEFAGEDHGSVRPAAIARALSFALPPLPGPVA
jgi:predicted alpha/beta superfamily hydrolase